MYSIQPNAKTFQRNVSLLPCGEHGLLASFCCFFGASNFNKPTIINIPAYLYSVVGRNLQQSKCKCLVTASLSQNSHKLNNKISFPPCSIGAIYFHNFTYHLSCSYCCSFINFDPSDHTECLIMEFYNIYGEGGIFVCPLGKYIVMHGIQFKLYLY